MPDAITTLIADLSDPVAVSSQLASIAGAPVALRIDIADPPVPVVASVGEHEATAANADAAVCALGQAVVSAMQLGEPVSEVAPAAAEPPAATVP